MFKKILFLLTLPIACSNDFIQSNECVVLLHGLGRTAVSMKPIEKALHQAGYSTANIDYPSRSAPIAQLAEQAVPKGLGRCREQGAKIIHFVTHSMGGILIRYYLNHHHPELGRIVMISPPNHGSEVADYLSDWAIYRWLNGPAGQELGLNGLPNQLDPIDYSVGVITGDQPALWDRWFSNHIIPGQDDGKVSVKSAQLEGMADFLVVPYTHTFIMKQKSVFKQIIHFLRSGHFQHDNMAE